MTPGWKSLLGPFSERSSQLQGGGKGGTVGARGLKDTERARTKESTKLGSWALTKTEAVITKSAKAFSRSFAYMSWFQIGGLGNS